MSGLIYCREPRVTAPYYVRELGISLYSAEELSFYIVNYVLLLTPEFLDENLLSFIGTQLGRTDVEEKIRRWLSQGSDLYQVLLMILQDLHFYSEEELLQFKGRLDGLRQAGEAELMKEKGDFFLELRQFGNAERTYAALLADPGLKSDFAARIWHNRGVAGAELMEYQEAMDCFYTAWKTLKEEAVVKEMAVLAFLDPTLTVPEEALKSVSGETQYRWKEEMEAFEKNAAYMGKAEDIAQAYSKDVIRRREAVRNLLRDWKAEYREMAG